MQKGKSWLSSEHALLWGLVVLALLFRLFLMRYRFAAAFDEVNYLKLAMSAAAQGPQAALHAFWTPLLPWFTALLGKLTGDFEFSGRLFSILCGVGLMPLLYFTFQPMVGRKAALGAVIWAGFAPTFAFYQTGVITEPLYTFVGVFGMIWGWRALTHRSWREGAIAGGGFGLAYLTRPEGIGFIMVFIAILFAVACIDLLREKRLEKSLLRLMLSASVTFLMVASPYLLFLHSHTGHWTISGKTANLQGEAYGQVKKADEQDVYRLLSSDNRRQLIDQLYHEGSYAASTNSDIQKPVVLTPVIIFKKYVKNVYKILKEALPSALSTVLFVLVTLGLFAVPWSRERTGRELYFLAYFTLFWFVVMPVFHPNERQFLPLMPICFIWAGLGMMYLANWLEKTFAAVSFPKAHTLAWMGLCIFLSFGVLLPEMGRVISTQPDGTAYWDTPVEQKTAGLWLSHRLRPSEGIMSRYHTVDYYAGNSNITQSVDIPLNGIERIAQYAMYKKVKYLVINERYILDNPNMRGLLYQTESSPLVELIYEHAGPKGLKTVIYQFTDTADIE